MSDNAPAAGARAAKANQLQASALKQFSFQWVRGTRNKVGKWQTVLNAIEDYAVGKRGGKHFVGGRIRE